MRHHAFLCAALVAALLFPGLATATPPGKHPRHGLILHDDVSLRAAPSNSAAVIAVLVEQTQVDVLKKRGSWRYVRIWASVKGWVPSRQVVFRKPWTTTSTYRAPVVHYHVHAYPPRALRSQSVLLRSTSVLSSPGGAVVTHRAAGPITVSAWRQDATGHIWYGVHGGWVPAASTRLVTTNPVQTKSAGRYLWQRVSGKGMWITLGPIAQSQPRAIVHAALHSGITHLYVESAISPLGFHGKDSIGPLVDEAHRHGIAVLAWVYPYLYDIASDVQLTRAVASYRTATGGRLDGIAADLERNMTAEAIGSYSQLIRAYLGPTYLLVGVTYPPQSIPSYPFDQVARSYNVIAPMDYWHQTATAYGLDFGHMKYSEDYARRYAADSITSIRRVAPGAKIAPIGQVFDNFGHEEMGPHAPSGEELHGFMSGSKGAGAIGVSFFQWMTATESEWNQIQRYRF
jgi:SH3 domain-containing protein